MIGTCRSSWGSLVGKVMSQERHPDGLVGIAERAAHAPAKLTPRQEALILRCHGRNVTLTRLSAATGLAVRHVRRFAKDNNVELA